jgi:NAD(P)-dependent dehydrogenase (short-subunit alcohol dehydrogenase family)
MAGLLLTGFEGKVALVTGTGRMSSIGHSIAVEMARAGCDVVVTGTGRPPERYTEEERRLGWRDIESVAQEIRDLGRRALPVVTDVGDEERVEKTWRQAKDEFGRIDFLVNNAAAANRGTGGPVASLTAEKWDYVQRVNLRGAFLMSRAFVQQAISDGKGGAIVNISSEVAKSLPPGRTSYAASKIGMLALTSGMCHEVGPNGIRVNAICAGLIDTARSRAEVMVPEAVEAMTGSRGLGRFKPEGRAAYIKETIPLGRAGTGEDVAYMTVFLCSDQGAWISGQHISVDGGQTGR